MKAVPLCAVALLWLVSRPVLAGSDSTGDCGPGTVKVCGTVTVPNTSGATANDFHFYMYQNDRASVQVMGATASSAGCDAMDTSLGTDDGTGSPPPGNHGAWVDASGCTPIPPGGSVSVQICLCMNERNCIKFKDIQFTSDGTLIEPGGGGGGGPPPSGGWRIQRPYRGGGGGSGVPGGTGGRGAQEDDGGTGNWIHIVCIENDDARWVVLENLKLLASMTHYANPRTDIDWSSIEPVADASGRPPACIPPGGRWCFPFETTGAYLGGHVYQQYEIRPEFTGECSSSSSALDAAAPNGDGDNTMTVVGDHPPETPLTEVLDISHYLDDQISKDYYNTTSTTAVTFGGDLIPAIPADFFGPGSEPFTGTVQMKGVPDPAIGDADTVIRRRGEAYLPFDGSVDTIPIEIHQMSLVSVEPIIVTYQQPQPLWFDVIVPTSQTGGTQVIKTHLNHDGGLSVLGIRETSAVNPTPPNMLLSMTAGDSGGPVGASGTQLTLDLQFQPTLAVPSLPPISGARVQCRVTPPSGVGLLPMEPPTVHFTQSSFDVTYSASPDGLSTVSHHIHGAIPAEQPLLFQSVQIMSYTGTSSFEVAFILQATGAVALASPLIRMTEEGGSEQVSSDLYDVSMTLDPGFPALGAMSIQRDSPNGGTFTTALQVRPQFTFTRVNGGPPTPPLPNVMPYPIQQMAPDRWRYAPPAFPIAESGPNFFPIADGPMVWIAPDGSPYTVVPALPPQPFGHAVYLACSAASPGVTSIELLPSGEVLNMELAAQLNAEQKRDKWVSMLRQQAPEYDPAVVGPGSFALNSFSPGSSVRFATGTTAESLDGLRTAGVREAQVAFANAFNPFDGQGQPAVFTAGIVTDVGELTAQISAAELNFHTDGPMICQALFQRLAPNTPPLGAHINFAGDRLEIYFDPAYTVLPSGITFGTTSLTSGCFGEITLPCPPGDLDCDSDVDQADVGLFAQCASGPAVPHDGSDVCRRADLDDDRDVDQSDFGGLQRCLSGRNNPADPGCGK